MASICCCIGSSERGAFDAGCKSCDGGDGGSCEEDGALSLTHCDGEVRIDEAGYADEEGAAALEENMEDEDDFVRAGAVAGSDWKFDTIIDAKKGLSTAAVSAAF